MPSRNSGPWLPGMGVGTGLSSLHVAPRLVRVAQAPSTSSTFNRRGCKNKIQDTRTKILTKDKIQDTYGGRRRSGRGRSQRRSPLRSRRAAKGDGPASRGGMMC